MVSYPAALSTDFHSRLDKKQLPFFDEVTNTVTDLLNVNHEGNILQDAVPS